MLLLACGAFIAKIVELCKTSVMVSSFGIQWFLNLFWMRLNYWFMFVYHWNVNRVKHINVQICCQYQRKKKYNEIIQRNKHIFEFIFISFNEKCKRSEPHWKKPSECIPYMVINLYVRGASVQFFVLVSHSHSFVWTHVNEYPNA